MPGPAASRRLSELASGGGSSPEGGVRAEPGILSGREGKPVELPVQESERNFICIGHFELPKSLAVNLGTLENLLHRRTKSQTGDGEKWPCLLILGFDLDVSRPSPQATEDLKMMVLEGNTAVTSQTRSLQTSRKTLGVLFIRVLVLHLLKLSVVEMLTSPGPGVLHGLVTGSMLLDLGFAWARLSGILFPK
ncbi:hypothetical protein MJG53_012589 [Ovis ammon polii x Ovis aries]|uniref:Uncharacterized protein n=1 Tax=Ovis ammon polii x Ovis aries TaxID=2918886 RepID=A0ACB9ULB5_9CETA|nr:hypothetical protein MJG53_012589 [Ovis ammon polii x Ovis aries]